MPSGWEVYYVVFLSALLALGIPALLGLISWFFSSRARGARSEIPGNSLSAPERPDSALGRRINTRFFLSANAALILITLALILIPYAGTLQDGLPRGTLVRGLVSIVTIAGFAALGLFYSAKKGDLDWLKSYRHEEGRR